MFRTSRWPQLTGQRVVDLSWSELIEFLRGRSSSQISLRPTPTAVQPFRGPGRAPRRSLTTRLSPQSNIKQPLPSLFFGATDETPRWSACTAGRRGIFRQLSETAIVTAFVLTFAIKRGKIELMASAHKTPILTVEAALGLTEVARILGVHPRTIERRRGLRKSPRPLEAQREKKLYSIWEELTDLFTPENAIYWLRHPVPVLENRRPVDMMAEDGGLDRVLEVIGRMSWGLPA